MRYTLLLKDIRKSRGMTQAELGEKVGTTARVVGSWERMENTHTDGRCLQVC